MSDAVAEAIQKTKETVAHGLGVIRDMESEMSPYDRFYWGMTPQVRGRYEKEREAILGKQCPPCKAIVTLISKKGETRKTTVPFFGPPEVGFSNMNSDELRDWWRRHCKRHGVGTSKKESMLLVEINAGNC